jgi:methyl-accepting chemotaxis protein
MENNSKDLNLIKLNELEHLYKALNKVQAIIEFNLDGTILTANENFLKTLGYTLEEIKGKHHKIFCDPSYVTTPAYKEFWKKLSSGAFEASEFKRIAKDGAEVWINASYNPIFDENGQPYKVVKFATDITESKTKNAEYEGKLLAIDKVQARIEFNLDGTIITANNNFLNTLGYSLDEIKGKHHRMFCVSTYMTTAAYTDFWQKLGQGENFSGEFKRIGKSGNEVWINASYNPIFNANGKPYKVVKYATDITKEKVKAQEFSEKVVSVSQSLAEKIEEISEKSSNVASGAQSLGATAEEMNASVEELTASIDSIAQNTKNADQLAKSTEKEAEIGSKSITKSVEAMELINKSSEEISEIVKVISEIASQTNLLAFNAAIEAARAGEHGLGFSVVADEVRKLAERSSQATKDISKLINESVKRVTQGTEISRLAGVAFEKIVEGVAKTTQAISEISCAAEEQLIAAKEVSNAIQHVAEQTEISATASDTIAQSTKMIKRDAEFLNKNVIDFAA